MSLHRKQLVNGATDTAYLVQRTQSALISVKEIRASAEQKSSGVLIYLNDYYLNDYYFSVTQDQFDSIQETAEILKDEKIMDALRNEDREETFSLEEARKRLGF